MLRADYVKRWIVVPLVSILSCFFFLIFLYWRIPLRKKWLYKAVEQVEQATQIYIEGKGK